MKIGYSGHIENTGWTATAYDGETCGTVGDALRLEALIIELVEHEGIDIDVNYQVHVQNYGWMDWVAGGAVAGTEGEGLRLEAIRIILVGTDASKYELKYRLHVENIGWQVWYSDGEMAGTTDVALRAEAVEIRIRKLKDDPTEDPDITIPETPVVSDILVIPVDTALAASYSTHIENKGWQKAVHGGIMAGTAGKALRLEAIRINVINFGDLDLGISYETHIENVGWLSAVANGVVSGTTGEGKRLEAIKINLTGADAADYMVWYRGHGQNYGWTEYSHDGEICGTEGEGLRLEAIEILITKVGVSLIRQPGEMDGISTRYQTHIENLDWTPWVLNGVTSGTTGRGLRMEAFVLELYQFENIDVSVSYRGHIQDVGWQNWVNEGEICGTTGEGLRLEAIEIILTGSAADEYDLLYRVHIENYGWSDFVKEGTTAGTTGEGLRLEAISVILLKKADQSAIITNEVVNKIPYVQIWGQNFPFEPFLLHDIRTDYKMAGALQIAEGQNKSKSFSFDIDPTHEYYDDLHNMRTTIQVYEIDSNLSKRQVFEGRVFEKDSGFNRIKTVTCEGEFGYLNDSIQRPKKFENMTPEEFLTNILNIHNMSVTADKRFFMGVCTVVNEKDNASRELTEYKKTINVITETVNSLGGYLAIRHVGNIRFLDYLESYRVVNSQPIEFGKNLLDVRKTDFSNGVITALIPYGAEVGEGDEKHRIDIKTVNDSCDFIYDPTAVAVYGWLFDSVEFDSVEDPTLLLQKGREYLDIASHSAGISIEVDAIDLNQINIDIERIKLGDNVRVVSKPHDIDMYLPVTKITRMLGRADKGKITLGSSIPALTDYVSGAATRNYYGDPTANSIKNLEFVSNELSFLIKTTAETVDEQVTTINETALAMTAFGASLTSTQTTVSSLGEQVNQAGVDITALSAGLSAAQTSLDGKVSTASIIASINASGESGVKIIADKLTLTGVCTFSNDTVALMASNARTNAVNDVKTGLTTDGFTTIDGGNISTANLTFSGGITGSMFGIVSSFSISTDGNINVPSGGVLNFGSTNKATITKNSSADLWISNPGAIYLHPTVDYTRIYKLSAEDQPRNIPLTSTTAANKINKIQYIPNGSEPNDYIQFELASPSWGQALVGINPWQSDRNLKTNIQESKIDALATISKIRPRSYNWKRSGEYEDCGFIAQEIEQDLGEKHVMKIKQDDGSISYQLKEKGFVPLLTKAIQELNTKFKETTAQQANEIAYLKYQIKELKGETIC